MPVGLSRRMSSAYGIHRRGRRAINPVSGGEYCAVDFCSASLADLVVVGSDEIGFCEKFLASGVFLEWCDEQDLNSVLVELRQNVTY